MRKSMRVRPCFKYDKEQAAWLPIEGDISEPSIPNKQKLVISTYNVLYHTSEKWGWLKRPLYKEMDMQRWNWTLKTKLPQLNSGIACFNEVVKEFVAIAKEDELIRNEYYISHNGMFGFGNFVVSRYPFHMVRFTSRIFLLLFHTLKGEPILVAPLHLSPAENGTDRRKEQLTELFDNIHTSIDSEKKLPYWQQVACALSYNNLIVLGDMNYISLGETRFMYELGFKDKWLDIKQLDPGFTWDAKLNPFIRKLWSLAGRRLRLDRIFVKENSSLIRFASIEIFGQEGIGVKHLLTDYRGSDHFGLSAEIYLDSDMKEQHKKFEYFEREGEILQGRDPQSYGDAMYKLFI